jgi:uncharacterized protein (TIGR02147 family)
MKPETILKTQMQPLTNDSSVRHSPIEVIRNLFNDRKAKNSNYSMNAYARDLGLSPSLLSRLFSGARALTLKQGMQIAAVMGLNQAETNLFILGIIENSSSTAKISKKVRETIQRNAASSAESVSVAFDSPLYVNYDVERFKTISQWYHLAILNLTFTDGFIPTAKFISTRLGITTAQAKGAIDRLLELGFLEETIDGTIRKTQANLYFKTERSELAMREYQTQMLDKAKTEMQKTSPEDFAQRLINSITFACAAEHVPMLKKKIDEFQDEVLALTRPGPHQEIYQMNCQLFPLTKPLTSTLTTQEKKNENQA